MTVLVEVELAETPVGKRTRRDPAGSEAHEEARQFAHGKRS